MDRIIFWEDLPEFCRNWLEEHGIAAGDSIPSRKIGRLSRSALREELLEALDQTNGLRTKAYELMAKKWECTPRHVMRRLKDVGLQGDGTERSVSDN